MPRKQYLEPTIPTIAPKMVHDGLDLSVIDHAFGAFADLYSDVLRVSVVATHEQIQLAYFDRRSELFTLLAKIDSKPQDSHTASERFTAERKMDSVVLAVRILGDPEQRLQYDRIRQERLLNRRRAEHGQLPGHEANARVASGLDSIDHHDESPHQKKEKRKSRRSSHRERSVEREDNEQPKSTDKKDKKKQKQSKNKSKRKKKEEEPEMEQEAAIVQNHSNETQATDHMTDEEDDRQKRAGAQTDTDEMRQDDAGIMSLTPTDYDNYSLIENDDKETSSGMLSCITNSRILRKLTDEISGACEDTLVSVDQVFNAFTLTDRDIRAVTKRIDKAKRQLEH